jgi:molybdopterin converting factor small subunit
MIIHVRAIANFRDILGKDLRVELKDESTVKELRNGLFVSHQRLKSVFYYIYPHKLLQFIVFNINRSIQ